jgi:hypothetical protein
MRRFAVGSHSAAALFTAFAVWSVSRTVQADEAGKDEVAAQVLYDEGRKLMEAGDPAAACPKFEESQRLDPSPGTQLNLALCYEATGRTATAWTLLREVETVSRRKGDAARASFARLRADAIEPKLSRITIRIAADASVAGLRVTRDGFEVGDAQQGIAVPVDSGLHLIAASAPGKVAWETKIEVQDAPRAFEVVVPRLEAAPLSFAPAQAAARGDAAPPAPIWSLGRTLAIVAGATGVASYGVATYLGFRARALSQESEPHCDAANFCDDEGVGARREAGRLADAGTVLAVVGTAALAGGVVLWLTAPSTPVRASVVATPNRIGATLTF